MKAAPARLYCLLAREARTGVIFRRGPSRHVHLIKWNLNDDTFEFGQWLKGRIYERRCDLSPNGDKLIYFAATYKEPLMSWTALSKPPWLTAIALWPKGDGWNGGGYFDTDTDLVLNHPQDQSELQPDSDLGDVRVTGYAAYRGEDDTVHHHLLRRGGWQFIQEAVWKKHENKRPDAIGELIQILKKSDDPLAAALEEHGMTLNQLENTKQSMDSFLGEESTWSPDGWIADKPEVWEKPSGTLVLRQELHSIARRNHNWYDLRYLVKDLAGATVLDLGTLDWAEWDTNGDLVFARAGCLYRAMVNDRTLAPETLLADFNALAFEVVASPESARRW
jgi:hypothetical protein